MYKTYYNVLNSHLEDLEIPYMDCDILFIFFQTKDILADLSKVKDFFDSSNPDENPELFSNMKKMLFVNLNLKCLKAYALMNYVF